MVNDTVFLDVQASLLKYCNDATLRNPIIFKNFDIFDFDSHASINELPDKDTIGIGEFSMVNAGEHYYVTFSVIISTKSDDSQLKRLRPAVNAIFSELKPGSGAVSVVDSVQGITRGNLVVMDDVTVLPVARADNRPVQMIAVHMASSFISPP